MQKRKRGIALRAILVLLVLTLAYGATYAFAATEEPYSDQWTVPADSGDSILIDMSSVKVVVNTHSASEVSAVFEGRRSPASGGTMPYIEATKTGKQITIKTVWPKQGLISFGNGSVNGTLTVLVPESLLESVDVNTFSGNVEIENLTAAELSIDTSSGNVAAKNHTLSGDLAVNTFSGAQVIENIQAQDVTLSASSGNVTLTGLEASGSINSNSFSGHQAFTNVSGTDIHMEASSGNLAAENMTAAGDLTLDTFSGKQNLRDVTADIIDSSASSGNIEWDIIKGRSMTAETFSGRITMSQASFEESAIFTTSSGDITISGIEAAELACNTFSGTVQADGAMVESFEGDTSSGRCTISFTGGANVQIETFSGDVKLLFPQGTGLRYTYDTFSGKATIEGEGGTQDSDGKNASGVFGDEGYAVTVNTSSGDLDLVVGK